MLGTIISNEETPSTKEFCFVLGPERVVSIGQLVKVRTLHSAQSENNKAGEIIAVVKRITRQNRYYEFAESISQYSKEAKSFETSFPAKDWEYTTIFCTILGNYADDNLARCGFPPSPGDAVFDVEPEVTKKVLGITDNGLLLGHLLASDLHCTVDISRLLQKHLAVLGMSGSGKSHLVNVIIEELLKRDPNTGRLAVIVLDPHGDYAGFSHPASPFRESTIVVKGDAIQISAAHLSASLLSELAPSLTAAARREYSKLFAKVKEACATEGKPITLDELITASYESTKTNLSDILDEVGQLKLFGAFDSPGVNIVKPGKLVVFDLSNLSNRAKQVVAWFFGRKLFNQRRQGNTPPFVLVVEEAHLFAREKAKSENSISKPVIESIAREGRKFGACLCLVSQRPVQLSTTALSQCNSFIVMRVTNPYDLQHIGESCEGIDKNSLDAITTLRPGEGIVIGEATNFPTFVKIRPKSTLGTSSVKLEDLAKEFESKTVELKPSDVDAFL